MFTRVFDNSTHYKKARSLGILNFDNALWEAVKNKQVGQSYEFSIETGYKPQGGQIHYRTKSAKRKHRLHPDELQRIAETQQVGKMKKKLFKSKDRYSFPIEDKSTGEKRFITKYRKK